ncbi:uncharacterized protein N7515_000954 [Penicillium bovifimosum]|uniref:Uncharacterized protein n=1 Tax=Penicillium bovifimosum TaxID=126998 RepID=A0A9W9HGC6_9EURO|nr:uncharacterized protein N7515_000954 [Penicillium bovifimosum]KAJ5146390.1 hypothetical protein N7515_000954 [Penicillium bovifimosum]
MPQLFCCTALHQLAITSPQNPTLKEFTKWATTPTPTYPPTISFTAEPNSYTQFTSQLNGSTEYIRCFTATDSTNFEETSEARPARSKRVAHERLRCKRHERVFEISVYEFGSETGSKLRKNIAKVVGRIENAVRRRGRSVSRSGSSSAYRSSSAYGYRNGMPYGSESGLGHGGGCRCQTLSRPVERTTMIVAEPEDCGSDSSYSDQECEVMGEVGEDGGDGDSGDQAASSMSSLDVDSEQDYTGEEEMVSPLPPSGEEIALGAGLVVERNLELVFEAILAEQPVSWDEIPGPSVPLSRHAFHDLSVVVDKSLSKDIAHKARRKSGDIDALSGVHDVVAGAVALIAAGVGARACAVREERDYPSSRGLKSSNSRSDDELSSDVE